MPPIPHGQQNDKPTLNDLFSEGDEFGLLNVKAKERKPPSPEIARFEEVNHFVDSTGRLPNPNSKELSEKALARRLLAFQTDSSKFPGIREWDRHGLLPAEDARLKTPEEMPPEGGRTRNVPSPDNVKSLADIFLNDEMGLLDVENPELFDLVNVGAYEPRSSADIIARRKACADFHNFQGLFSQAHLNIRNSKWSLVRFQRGSDIFVGDYFVLNGVMCLVDEIGEYKRNVHGHLDARLRLIYENGTESNLLLLSLVKELFEDEFGRKVVVDAKTVEDKLRGISHRDQRSGLIYIVTSRSNHSELLKIPHLHKIGYTELTVEERVKNASEDETFLEAPVRILTTFECFNLNPQKFELLLHGFLHHQRLSISLVSKSGKMYRPREWFSVPLDTAREAATRIIDGTIVQYRMDNTTGRIVPK